MKIWPYLTLAVALPILCLLYIISLGYTPIAGAVLTLPNETEILLFTVFAAVGAATIGHFLGYRRIERLNRNNPSRLEQTQKGKTMNPNYVVIVIVVLALFVIPFVINSNAEFGGTDGQGPDAIEERGYSPWIGNLGYVPDDLGERLFFSLQVGIGAGILGFFVGHEMGKAANKTVDTKYTGEKLL
jgi:cobalt/nickel transport protein